MGVTLNCGIGMVVICSESEAQKLTDILQENGESVNQIGYIQKTQGDHLVEINNTDTAWKS